MKWSTRDITYVALFVTFAIICAFLTRFLAYMTVPFNLVPFVAILAGAMLGKRLGAYAMLTYLIIGLIGIPVFAGDPPFGTFAYVLKPTFGFILAFVPAAFVTGWVLEKRAKRTVFSYSIAALSGMATVYIVGLPYLYTILNMYLGNEVGWWGVLTIGFFPFVLLDIVKAIAAALVAYRMRALR